MPITQETADIFKLFEKNFQELNNNTFNNTYFFNGRFPRKGEIFKNPDLAHSLEIIAKKGKDGFIKEKLPEK